MGQKDLSQKCLEAFPDVFADCVNALLYGGKRMLQEDCLLPAPTETVYSGHDDWLHNQFQDVSKYERTREGIRTQYTIENQTKRDRRMALRKSGYEGAIYRAQYQGRNVYPVISLVLYWGKGRWNSHRSLKELIGEGYHQEELAYVDNVQLHVYEMAHLPSTVRQRFQSDMRIVVDLLAEGPDYKATDRKIVHVEAFLLMMRALTGDNRYEELLENLTEQEKREEMKMCEFLDAYLNERIEQGLAQGLAQGLEQGKAQGLEQGRAEIEVETVRNMHRLQMTAETIAKLVNRSCEYVEEILRLIFQYPREDDHSIAVRLLTDSRAN